MKQRRSSNNHTTRQEIADSLRAKIISGVYEPGGILPSRHMLCDQFAGSYVTVQAAVKQLESEGFVISRRGSATHVVDHPPHTCHYAMLVEDAHPAAAHENAFRFLSVLTEEVNRLNAGGSGLRIHVCYDRLDKTGARASYHELVDMARAHRLAGIIHPFPPLHPKNTALLAVPGIVHVTAAAPVATAPELTHIAFNWRAFFQRALDRIAEDGRRRVAVLTTMSNIGVSHGQLPHLVTMWATRCGLVTRPFWIVPVDPYLAPGINATTRLLFDGPPDQRPDALIIDDDHMVHAASEALAAAGIDTETDVTVIGHCNFPRTPPTVVPIVRLGLDCRDLLQRMLDTIDRRVRGEPVEAVTWVDPLFEPEFQLRYQIPADAPSPDAGAGGNTAPPGPV